jgi:hypothetical protein
MTPKPTQLYSIPIDYEAPRHAHKPVEFTQSELIFAAWLGGFVGVLVTVAAAAIWALVL